MQDHNKTNIGDLEARRIALQNELRQLESSLERNFETLQDDVNDRMTPTFWVKKYPLRTVGLAVLVGFLAGSRDKSDVAKGTTVVAAVVAALKAVAARKIVDQVVKIVEGESDRPDNH